VVAVSVKKVHFSATALADAAKRLVKQSLDPQTATVVTGVVAPVVKVADSLGNAVAGVIVDFVVTHGGLLGAVKDTSDLQGHATTGSWTLGSLVGTNTVTATAGALPAVTFSATGVAGAPAQLALVTEPGHWLAGDTMALVRVVLEAHFTDRVAAAQVFV